MHRFFRSYEGQSKTFLVLLVVFLAASIYLSFHLLALSRNALYEEVRLRIALAAEAVLAELQVQEATPIPRGNEAIFGSSFSQGRFFRIARDRGFASLEILDAGGSVAVSSTVGRVGARDAGFERLGDSEKERLLSGTTVLSPLDTEGGTAYATMSGYRPLLDRVGRLTGTLRVQAEASTLAEVDRSLKILSAVQAGGLSALLILVFYFARWLLTPYRKLLATAGEAGALIASDPPPGREPDFLVSSFQTVLEKMRRQELELQQLKGVRTGGVPGAGADSVLADSLTSGMVRLDREGRISLVNRAGLRILGRTRSDLEGRTAAEAFGGEDALTRLIREGLDQGRPRSREMVPHRRPDGREIHLGVGLSPLTGEGGIGEGVICLLSDLTEIRLLRERVALKENLAQIGELSAGIAHEFRNSLATILGYARLVSRGEDPEQRGMGDAILREAQGITKVVENYLQFARPAALNLAEVHLGTLLEDLAGEFSTPGGNRPFTILVRGEFPPLRGDEALLKQAFHNLFRNALEARDGKGTGVTITGAPEEGGMLRIEVVDDGPGISPEVLPRIFTPFFTTRPGGTGLGLPLVQKTVVSHDGTIEAASKLGEGVRFLIRLPLIPETQRVPAA